MAKNVSYKKTQGSSHQIEELQIQIFTKKLDEASRDHQRVDCGPKVGPQISTNFNALKGIPSRVSKMAKNPWVFGENWPDTYK